MKALLLALAFGSMWCFSASSITPYCAESVREIEINDKRFLGFSGQDLLNIASLEQTLDWQWDYRFGYTTLNMKASARSNKARYIESVAVYPIGSEEIEVICADRIEVDVWLYFTTQDGAFLEVWESTLYDTDGTDSVTVYPSSPFPGQEAHFTKTFYPENIRGAFYNDLKMPSNAEVSFLARGKFGADSSEASVSALTQECDGIQCYHYWLNAGHSY